MAAPAERSRSNRSASERVRLHIAAATECAGQIAQDGGLSERQRRSILHAFRRVLLPTNRPRRWRKKKLTRACEDYEKGMRGGALFQKHIPRWDRLGCDSRTVRSWRLMASIRKRQSREKKTRTKQATVPATKPLE
jgi:hypothetical protein